MKVGEPYIRKFSNGGPAIYSPGGDYANPVNFELYNQLSGLDPEQFAEQMRLNFGMITERDDEGNLLDYSQQFQQYDDTAQHALKDTYTSALGKGETKARNTLEEAFRLSRGAPQGFGGGSPLQEAFDRSFTARKEGRDLAQQQYHGGVFDLQSDFGGAFEDQMANLSAIGVQFKPPTSGTDILCEDGTYAATEADCP